MPREIVCKSCKRKCYNYGHGLCYNCYMKDYMKKLRNYGRAINNITGKPVDVS